jgi:hypothetical protein
MKKMRFYSLAFFMLVLLLCTSGMAQATVSWQTTPILGYSASDATGDVVIITGPQPFQPGGAPYLDIDGNIVMGPTIPHYSIPGDPLYHVGSPSITTFFYNPNTFKDGHWTDTVTQIWSGSGVNLQAGNTYSYSGIFSFLGTPGNPAYLVEVARNDTYVAPDNFIMLMPHLYDLWLEDAGHWTYTETWTDNLDQSSISFTREFTVTPVPLPAGILLLGPSLAGLFGLRRKFGLKG